MIIEQLFLPFARKMRVLDYVLTIMSPIVNTSIIDTLKIDIVEVL